uniref:Uncharacterized protein n=1 Tax=Anopheles merus TaxID=30066 RepID=A0A182V0E3_ANOME
MQMRQQTNTDTSHQARSSNGAAAVYVVTFAFVASVGENVANLPCSSYSAPGVPGGSGLWAYTRVSASAGPPALEPAARRIIQSGLAMPGQHSSGVPCLLPLFSASARSIGSGSSPSPSVLRMRRLIASAGARPAGHPIDTSPERTPEALLERKICIVVVVGSDGRCGRCCGGREFRLFRPRHQLGPLAGLEKAGQIRMPMGPLAAVVREGWQRSSMMMVWLLLMMLGVWIGPGREGRWLAQVQRFVVGKGSCPECRY